MNGRLGEGREILQEVKHARQMKSGKAAGIDEKTTEMLKALNTTTTVYFKRGCFSQCTGVNLVYGLPFLHLDLFQASSLQSLFSLISSVNTSLHLFLAYLSLHHHLPTVS